ncbi:flagella basal body P-ring formation protein FlgA [Paracoccus solventivorans]|uniref:Flagella basal body P-ring formation protein FlgA n=1 Tax=Paracoccus solventivorans TaxID=53463 RepID=A0A1M7JP37_9RHOB|nr:flagellar basal body P-ring formation chaperone FlgA [Paracoccus solventivorans]SHM54493.1 flagella basal body P-ring formation protein FlgA [Paracoccus solventivorans]
MRMLFLLALLPGAALADGLVAARVLPAGTVLTAADIIAPAAGGNGLSAEQAIGQQLRSAVYQGRPITAAQLTTPTLVNRNQIVTLAYDNAALRIETEARALGAGSAGDVIRVMNLASRATLSARINPDGTLSVAQR